MNVANVSSDSYEIQLKRVNGLPKIWIEVLSLVCSLIVVSMQILPLCNLCDPNPNKSGKIAQEIVTNNV
jgi:hypothetical protein